MYVIMQQNGIGINLFLVDRSITRKLWWSRRVDIAQKFSRAEAEARKSTLNKGRLSIETYEDALEYQDRDLQ